MSAAVRQALPVGEFVPLMALIISLGALSIDAMLPALGQIATDLNAADANQGQWVISAMFLGFSIGQLLYGPLSDSIGRKPSIYIGMAFFFVGCGLSISASSFSVMLLGRVLQGMGTAAPRIVSMALVRDQYMGDAMARIMSLTMSVFILVPAIAPFLGQGIMNLFHWRAIFVLLVAQAAIATTWLAIRQPETLSPAHKKPLSPSQVAKDAKEVFSIRLTLGYTIVFGLVFANFIGYLTSAPQLFSDIYDIVDDFPLYFAAIAGAIGLASVLNSKMVMRFGARRLAIYSLLAVTGSSALFLGAAFYFDGRPPLAVFMTYMMLTFFFVGGLMGNSNAIAMEPVGHIAGTAAAVTGSLSTLISLVIGSVIGQMYSGTIVPLVCGFTGLGLCSLLVVRWAHGGVAEAPT